MRFVTEHLEQNAARLFRFALQLTGDRTAAEDLAQETLLRAWRAREQVRDARATLVWMLRIASNVWHDWGRTQAQRPSTHMLADEPSDDVSTPLEAIVVDEELRQVIEGLQLLPERQREVLYLHACEGLSLAEVGDVLGLNANAVKVSLCIARRKMREKFQPSPRPRSTTKET